VFQPFSIPFATTQSRYTETLSLGGAEESLSEKKSICLSGFSNYVGEEDDDFQGEHTVQA
jgi:hypothetical protein